MGTASYISPTAPLIDQLWEPHAHCMVVALLLWVVLGALRVFSLAPPCQHLGFPVRLSGVSDGRLGGSVRRPLVTMYYRALPNRLGRASWDHSRGLFQGSIRSLWIRFGALGKYLVAVLVRNALDATSTESL